MAQLLLLLGLFLVQAKVLLAGWLAGFPLVRACLYANVTRRLSCPRPR